MADPFAARQVVRLEHRRQAGEVSRRRHGNLLEVAQLAGMQAGIARPADTHREVDALADQIAELVVGQHFHLDLGKLPDERRGNAADVPFDEILRRGDAQPATGLALQVAHIGERAVQLAEHALGHAEQQFAAIGKGHATGGTGQQLDPEVGLQASQLLAE